jgi:response regulator RpfG family c-di-GMP phosphodiesterase
VSESVEIIRSASGYHFDPAVVEAFLSKLDEVVEIKRTFVSD